MEDLTTIDVPQSHPRNAFKAAVFSLVFPGLGQVYNGQIKKGILYFALSYLIPVIFAVTRWATSFAGMVIFFDDCYFIPFIYGSGCYNKCKKTKILHPQTLQQMV
ncbi:hypothetical protein BV902_07800 [Sphingobacterium sp. B29]|uniref:DUF5683 domain-containing protein n=1 Tax=Sphingobacterium sp. B29 TaxID=1933220 RepID=UPI00095888A7|nr:DUF5683 domain-containing protein [Sphingobacterium sp. B29]APU96258.1 hypothetical protein BV902_07800 [Sphingobacterium sp. B29]